MDFRSLIQTPKRKAVVIVLELVVCAVVGWAIFEIVRTPSDEAKSYSVQRNRKWGYRVGSFQGRHRFPAPLANGLKKLQIRLYDKAFKQEKELETSGYLVSVPLMPWPGTYAPVRTNIANLQSAVGTNFYLFFYNRSNVVVVVCRSNDAPRIRALIEKQQ